MRALVLTLVFSLVPFVTRADEVTALPGTAPLTADKPLDELMVDGIDRFCLKEIERTRTERPSHWHADVSSAEVYEKSLTPYRDRFRVLIGAVDPRVPAGFFERPDVSNSLVSTATESRANDALYTVEVTRWPVLKGLSAEGLILIPKATSRKGYVIALPDARWSPDDFTGAAPGSASPLSKLPQLLAENGFVVIVPTLISRDDEFSGTEGVALTNQSQREWVYRSAFELGRHVIGYEVQKVLAAIDVVEKYNQRLDESLPVGVAGVGDGGLIALYSAALDPRIRSVLVSGYFQPREGIWQEPIDRNVWRLLNEFGDAELAGMIAPRNLVIEACAVPETDGPLPVKPGRRGGAAPGQIKTADLAAVKNEFGRVQPIYEKLKSHDKLRLVTSGDDGRGPAQSPVAIAAFVHGIGTSLEQVETRVPARLTQPLDHSAIQKRQVTEAVEFTQRLLRESYKTRDRIFDAKYRASLPDWESAAGNLREFVYQELIGKLPEPTLALNPRTRKVLDEPEYTGYEVVLDTYPEIIAAGILLLPKDLKPGDKRPVVVCQHGLEGVPMDTISGPGTEGFKYYSGFAAALAKRGFITYAPQNPYRGHDRFRTLQRKSNPLGRSLFSYIIPQHQVTLKWLASLPNVDPDRLAFYGLSYGGKTAVRVPPMLPPKPGQPGYCLSICSADYNEWVSKNASTDVGFAYVYTPEYEIFEWNMGHVANYAELSMLMTPRPFMVERGHDDGVGIDEWVAWEYAKVRRHYNKLGLGDRTEIEFFNGPHTIHGVGTYDFLHRQLKWPNR